MPCLIMLNPVIVALGVKSTSLIIATLDPLTKFVSTGRVCSVVSIISSIFAPVV